MERLLGRHAVLEALRAGRTLGKVYLVEGIRPAPEVEEILRRCRLHSVPVVRVGRRALDRMAGSLPHQGLLALAAARPPLDLTGLLERSGAEPCLVLLDGLQSPQNLGAILRSAEAAGAAGVVIPERRSAGPSEGVARASAGAVERLPVVRVSSLPAALLALDRRGFRVVGAVPTGGTPHTRARLAGPLALVIGSEARGLGALVRERCHELVSIPMRGRAASLNAAVAASVLLFERLRQLSPRGEGAEPPPPGPRLGPRPPRFDG
ncbi:MAG: 23S rRNA (guanosine(2251)-2'-O)-methyltransferase RlmB [Halobacteria archaeon]